MSDLLAVVDPQPRRRRGHRGVRRPRAGRRGGGPHRSAPGRRLICAERCSHTAPMRDERVIVVGAGVVGLTCAVRLLEAGLRVDVVARDLPRETTSAVAAAIWYPYRALPQDRVTAWARTSYAVFDALADTDPESGVRMLPGTEVLAPSGPTRGGGRRCRRSSAPVTSPATGSPAGRSPPRWSTWASTSAGSRTGSRSSAAPSPGSTSARSRRAGWSSTARASAPGCWARTGPSYRCAARSWSSSSSGSSGGGWTRPDRRTSCRASATSWSVAPTSRATGAALRPPETAAGDPGARCPAGAGAAQRPGAAAQGRAAPGAARGAARARRRRGPLLRPRRRRASP